MTINKLIKHADIDTMFSIFINETQYHFTKKTHSYQTTQITVEDKNNNINLLKDTNLVNILHLQIDFFSVWNNCFLIKLKY